MGSLIASFQRVILMYPLIWLPISSQNIDQKKEEPQLSHGFDVHPLLTS